MSVWRITKRRRKKKALEERDLSSAQEAMPVPWMAGEAKIAVTWISRVYNLHAQDVGDGGKK
jgi:hypothetical protein